MSYSKLLDRSNCSSSLHTADGENRGAPVFDFAHSFVSQLPPNETKNKVIFRAARVSSSSAAALGEIIFSFLIPKQTTSDLGSRTETRGG